MLTLYWAKDTGAMAPQILLEELEVDYERVILDLDSDDHKSAEYLSINPKGEVPELRLDDGSILTESAAIMMHIADLNIEADVIPTTCNDCAGTGLSLDVFCGIKYL